jgi:hypothetical protein
LSANFVGKSAVTTNNRGLSIGTQVVMPFEALVAGHAIAGMPTKTHAISDGEM